MYFINNLLGIFFTTNLIFLINFLFYKIINIKKQKKLIKK